jgi:hypothetical protein
MTIKKIALDSEAHLHLLTALFDIEAIIEPGDDIVLDRALAKLIDEVRYSEIIESYELMKDE